MKIFVAGATGAVGVPLVRTLCTLGHEVTRRSANGHGGSASGCWPMSSRAANRST
jgi:nucleoside-diphosphate-sugar epimerase